MNAKFERGSALIIALVVAIIAVGISGAFLADTVFRTKTQGLAVESDVAHMICDAAIEKVRRALWVYKTNSTYPWDQILADHSGLDLSPETHLQDYLARRNDPDFVLYYSSYYQTGLNTTNEAPLPTDPAHFLGKTQPFGEGGFYCVVRDNDDGDGDLLKDSDNQLLVYVTATLPDGTQRQIECLVKYLDPTYIPDNAIIVDGSILFNGTPDVLGIKGSAHANGDITLAGKPTFQVSANATGQINEGAAIVPPGGFNEGVPNVPLPDVDPTTLKDSANYILQSDGKIKDVASGAVIVPAGAGWNGWKYDAVNNVWGFSGGGVPPVGTYYVEGNAKLTGAAGSPQRTMSIVAEKCIETTGNIKLSPSLTGTLLIAGGDVKLGGSAGAQFVGLIAAHEQVKTNGTFDHQGVLLAKNASDVYNLVSAGSSVDPDSVFGGTMSVTYNGGLVTMLENPNNSVQVQNVRRIK